MSGGGSSGDSREEIFREAIGLFLSQGYEQTTMSDIMAATGMSKGAIYHHFDSKHAILNEYLNRTLEEITQYLEKLVAAPDLTATEKFGELLAYLNSNRGMSSLSDNNWAERLPFALLHTLRNSLNVLAPLLAQILQQGVDREEFDCPHPEEVASLLVLIFDVWLDPMIADAPPEAQTRKLDFIGTLLEKLGAPVITSSQLSSLAGQEAPAHE